METEVTEKGNLRVIKITVRSQVIEIHKDSEIKRLPFPTVTKSPQITFWLPFAPPANNVFLWGKVAIRQKNYQNYLFPTMPTIVGI